MHLNNSNPTPQQVLDLHFERAYQGELRYLNINTTYNSSIMLNYRQTENAFWTQYLPTVIGVLIPTYPPTTEFWWEPKEPLQIAFWSMSATCLFLIVLVFICCIMWRNAKRQSDRFYDDDLFIDPETIEYEQHESRATAGVDNAHMITNPNVSRSRDNIYEYRDSPSTKTLASKAMTDTTSIRAPSSLAMTHKSASQTSLKSAISLKESNGGTASTYTASNPRSQRHETNAGGGRIMANGNPISSSAGQKEEKRLLQQQQLQHRQPIPLSSTPATSEISYKSSKTGSSSQGSSQYPMAPVPNVRTVIPNAAIPAASTNSGSNYSARETRTQVIAGVPQTSV